MIFSRGNIFFMKYKELKEALKPFKGNGLQCGLNADTDTLLGEYRRLIDPDAVVTKSSPASTPDIVINEDELDIFDIPSDPIPDWEPELDIPEYAPENINVMGLDIETYSNNKLVVDSFFNRVLHGYVDKKDLPIYKFLCDRIIAIDPDLEFPAITEILGSITTKEQEIIRTELYYYIKENYESLVNFIDTIDRKGALNPNSGVIVLIGCINERGVKKIINCIQDEAGGIRQFLKILAEKTPTFLCTFNGFEFDLPFIMRRCEINRVKHPFWQSPHTTVFRSAQRFNKPTEYQSIWVNGGKTAIIDMYHQSLAWDFVNRTLTKFTLKQVVLQLKLRKEARLELSYEDMVRCVESGDIATLSQYLEYDLEDTKLITDRLLPDIYYQRAILPDWKYQSISTGGGGSKWNDIICRLYRELYNIHELPQEEKKRTFVGGLTGGKAGLFRNIGKFDFQSMYPNIMEIYQICSKKDTKKITLMVLKYLRLARIALKKIASNKSLENILRAMAKQRQGFLKVLINSAYGALAVIGKPYNCYESAAKVTAYGRALLKHMERLINEMGAVSISLDTDGIYFSYNDPTFQYHQKIHEHVQANMPGDFIVENELEAVAMYIPPAVGHEYTAANITDEFDQVYVEGMRKNYIIVFKDGSIKANGKFKKRDKCVLEKEIMPNLVKHYLDGTHDKYYQETLMLLMQRKYPVEKLSITRKIKSTEKRLVELGIGNHEDVVTIWKAPDVARVGKRGQELKKMDVFWTDDPQCIDWAFYINILQDQYKEFCNCPKY